MGDDKGYYRPIYTAIWDDEDFRTFDTNTKLVFFNLRVNRFGNFPCIYVCYLDTVASQTGLPLKAVKRAIDTLCDRQWIAYQYPIVWVIKALKNDPNWSPNNQKQVKGVVDIIKSLPKSEIVAKFISYYELDIGYRYPIDSPSIPYGIGYGSTETETETDKETEKREEKRGEGTGKAPSLSPLAMLWNEVCLNLPKVKESTPGRLKKESTRFKVRPFEQWREVFEKLEKSSFCKGINDREWKATFDWIIDNDENSVKVLEGKYDDKPKSQSPDQKAEEKKKFLERIKQA